MMKTMITTDKVVKYVSFAPSLKSNLGHFERYTSFLGKSSLTKVVILAIMMKTMIKTLYFEGLLGD